MKKNEKEYYLYKSVQDDNILPLTSKCNLSCIFCSHRQNPKDLEIISFGDLKINKIKDLIDYLNPDQPIIIGESATKIIEGEPLVHPDFREIIKQIRSKYKNTEIRITTNGDFLREKLIKFLAKNENITLNISVNYLKSELREQVMGNNCNKNLESTLNSLKSSGIEYNFSMVALPHLYGYETIKEEIFNMSKFNPLTIRIFMPGYTYLTTEDLKFDYQKVYQKLHEMIHAINLQQNTPVTIEPPFVEDLKSEVKGVIKGSPADKANLMYQDIIQSIDGKKTVSRVDTFNKIKNKKNPTLKIQREDNIYEINLIKEKEQRSGLIMDYDITTDRIAEINRTIKSNTNKKILFLTSELGYSLINYVIKEHLGCTQSENIFVQKVKSNYLKGSIISAGLLTNLDIDQHINKTDFKPDLLILPAAMYDIFNNDLRGKNYKSLENKHMFEVEIL